MTLDDVMVTWAQVLFPSVILGMGLLWALQLLYGGKR